MGRFISCRELKKIEDEKDRKREMSLPKVKRMPISGDALKLWDNYETMIKDFFIKINRQVVAKKIENICNPQFLARLQHAQRKTGGVWLIHTYLESRCEFSRN